MNWLRQCKQSVYPITSEDLPKALPLWGSLFLLTFCYYGTKCIKYAVFLDEASGGPGPRYIPYAKLITMLLSFICVIGYSKLCNHFLRERLCFILLGIFAGLLVFYDLIRLFLPYYSAWFMYSLSELYASVLQITMFWSMINNIFTVEEGKRIYPFIFIGSQVGGVGSGKIANLVIGTYGIRPLLYLLVALTMINAFLLYWYGSRMIKLEPDAPDPCELNKKKLNTSVFEGFTLVARRPYLMAIFIITACYNIAIIFVDYMYKVKMAHEVTGQNAIGAMFGNFYFYVNLLALFFLLFVTKNIIRNIGLTICLLILPLVMGVPALISFLTAGWLIGMIASGIGQAGKYAFFEPAKELLYVPCSLNEKYKAKAAIDMIGHRGGKGLSSALNILIYSLLLDWEGIVYSGFFTILLVIWIVATFEAGRCFKKLTEEDRPIYRSC